MKHFRPLKLRLRLFPSLAAMAAAICAAASVLVGCADPQSTNSAAANAKPKQMAKKLTGADLYAINCNRCHAERYPTEFTSAQWKTVMTHMRVRANLPAEQAKAILKYLQEDSGN
jgi:mono/diheme cytochrome c family protein